jgi:hypothetical protein
MKQRLPEPPSSSEGIGRAPISRTTCAASGRVVFSGAHSSRYKRRAAHARAARGAWRGGGGPGPRRRRGGGGARPHLRVARAARGASEGGALRRCGALSVQRPPPAPTHPLCPRTNAALNSRRERRAAAPPGTRGGAPPSPSPFHGPPGARRTAPGPPRSRRQGERAGLLRAAAAALAAREGGLGGAWLYGGGRSEQERGQAPYRPPPFPLSNLPRRLARSRPAGRPPRRKWGGRGRVRVRLLSLADARPPRAPGS